MRQNHKPTAKVFYRPMEAAVRWAGLLRYEPVILESAPSARSVSPSLNCPRRDEIQRCLDRIWDGLVNGELPYGQDGVTANDRALLDSAQLTIRHLDLQSWMRRYYPEQRPAFLFSRSERMAHPTITLESGQAMLLERRALKIELAQCRNKLGELSKKMKATCTPHSISDRAESTYLNIIGAMLDLMLGRSPSGRRYSKFDTQEAIISVLIAHHGEAMGISERTLHEKFSRARKALQSTLS